MEDIANYVMTYNNIKYIVVNKSSIGEGWDETNNPTINPRDFVKTIKFITDDIGAEKVYEDESRIVYEVISNENTEKVYVTFGDNWLDKKYIDDNINPYERVINYDSTLEIINTSNEPKDFEIIINMYTKDSNYEISDIYIDDVLMTSYVVTNSQQSYRILIQDITPGNHTLEFKINDKYGKSITFNNEGSGVYTNKITYKTINDTDELREEDEVIDSLKNNSIIHPLVPNIGQVDNNIISNDIFIDDSYVISDTEIVRQLPGFYELYFLNNPYFDDLEIPKDILDYNYYRDMLNTIFSEYEVEHLAIYREFLEPSKIFNLEQYINKYCNADKILNNSDVVVYKFNLDNKNVPTVNFIDNWGPIYNKETPTRDAKGDSTIELINYNDNAQNIILRFNARTCDNNNPRLIKFYLNGKPANDADIFGEYINYQILLDDVLPGSNLVRFEIYDQDGNIIDSSSSDVCTVSLNGLSAEIE